MDQSPTLVEHPSPLITWVATTLSLRKDPTDLPLLQILRIFKKCPCNSNTSYGWRMEIEFNKGGDWSVIHSSSLLWVAVCGPLSLPDHDASWMALHRTSEYLYPLFSSSLRHSLHNKPNARAQSNMQYSSHRRNGGKNWIIKPNLAWGIPCLSTIANDTHLIKYTLCFHNIFLFIQFNKFTSLYYYEFCRSMYNNGILYNKRLPRS